MVSLGKEIKKARIDKGLHQSEVQQQTGISQKHLSQIENDKVDPRWSMMRRLAAVLDLDLAALARDADDVPPSARKTTRPTRQPKAAPAPAKRSRASTAARRG